MRAGQVEINVTLKNKDQWLNALLAMRKAMIVTNNAIEQVHEAVNAVMVAALHDGIEARATSVDDGTQIQPDRETYVT